MNWHAVSVTDASCCFAEIAVSFLLVGAVQGIVVNLSLAR